MMKYILCITLMLITLCGVSWGDKSDVELAKTILGDKRLTEVLARSKAIIATGFNAGDGYGEVWIRDMATFIEISCEVYDRDEIKKRLLTFFMFQGEDGNIIDGYIPVDNATIGYDYIHSTAAPNYLGHKNTVETDQESSLIIAVCLYVEKTGDRSILREVINGKTVLERMEWAMEYLRTHRFSTTHGLIWGATTADWGDVQPENKRGVVLDESSHLAIDIYDNALFVVALNAYLDTVNPNDLKNKKWFSFRKHLRKNIRKHLWDKKHKKFIPHIYLEGSAFPADFDESEIYYHGGTAIAIQADLLSKKEVVHALDRMVENVTQAKASSIGLTMYPAYPDGLFKHPILTQSYTYQNGGDWTWFGGRMIQQLVRYELCEEAYREVLPMVERVIQNDGFYEWYSLNNEPRGSGTYRGSAGVLGRSIQMLQAWAEETLAEE